MKNHMILAVAIALSVVTACSDETSRTATPASQTATPASTSREATTSTSTTAVAAPVAFGPVTLVSGTVTYSVDQGTITVNPDGSSQSRNGTTKATLTSTDRRVTGTVVESWNSNRWGTLIDGALVQWGTSRLTNDGGAWEGPYTGVFTTKTTDVITWWYTGTGGYDGLTFFMWVTESKSGRWQGLIYPGSPPKP